MRMLSAILFFAVFLSNCFTQNFETGILVNGSVTKFTGDLGMLMITKNVLFANTGVSYRMRS